MVEESEYWKRRINLASGDDPEKLLEEDKKLFKKLRGENDRLREELRDLKKNNQKLVELAELMEDKVRKLTEDVKKNYVYSYEQGGWIEKGSMDKLKMEKPVSDVSVNSINNQLSEILRMIEKLKIDAVNTG